ncbi:formate dehydrogenase accessory sulfurtransferase FdhD [Cohnella sp. GCM10027633]|uniref:formate dehydrogenase accessory sulfurtransferase FdhD n=1 Tax=unclassified Cohnella TaxID=2636738 RepID=UPI00363E662B
MDGRMSRARTTIRWANGARADTEDEIAEEFPLTIRLDGEEFATIVCSPCDLDDLVVGFLASEGIIRQAAEIRVMNVDVPSGFAYVELVNPRVASKHDHSKRFIGSCCGKSRQFYLKSDARTARTIVEGPSIAVERCFELMGLLQASSTDFRLTGGVHNAAFGDPSEERPASLAAARADIGRHNALDKLYGHTLRNRQSARPYAIAFSGRLSSEVVLKAAKIGCAILLSKSAPTDLALNLADDLGITCVGFIRQNGLNVYTHPYRVTGL